MAKRYTATVQFCGAGGTSEGAKQVGILVEAAINHSEVALESHKANHPEAMHIRQSMEEVDPDALPDSDFLLTSPCCTNHSIARGQKHYHSFDLWGEIVYNPLDEKSRNTMDDVVRFASAKVRAGMPYKMIIVENVVDVVKWRKYSAWLTALIALGYRYQTLSWNSQFFGVPQSRDRVYIVFWWKEVPSPDLTHRPVAWCEPCVQQVMAAQAFKRQHYGCYGKQYVYRCPLCAGLVVPPVVPANTMINIADPGRTVGKRLAMKTQEKILAGIERYEIQPFLLGYYNNASYRLLSQPVGTITTRDRWALITPGTSIELCSIRMLNVREVKAAMGFPEGYYLEGDNKHQVWQLGNAVCPPVMTDILKRCSTALLL